MQRAEQVAQLGFFTAESAAHSGQVTTTLPLGVRSLSNLSLDFTGCCVDEIAKVIVGKYIGGLGLKIEVVLSSVNGCTFYDMRFDFKAGFEISTDES